MAPSSQHEHLKEQLLACRHFKHQKILEVEYLSGFGNHFESEAVAGALPHGRNNPRVCPYGLYAEQISGTAFTAPRKENQRSWLYRVKPSVTHEPFHLSTNTNEFLVSDFSGDGAVSTPNQLRWKPVPQSADRRNFIQGLFTICGSGNSLTKNGFAIHLFTANESMEDKAFANADGDFLIIPQEGSLLFTTEFGLIKVSPGEIVVIPSGIRFSVSILEESSRGYVCEVFGSHFQLPELGPIGSNGLANPRDFLFPKAFFDPSVFENKFTVVHKFDGKLFEAKQDFSPFNVVAWHGNYVPYKYDLSKFCPVNSVLFDHPDPSIFTVLTCPSPRPGIPLLDFVLFPPRWTVAEDTFRPPYFHRNTMSEFMGLIRGEYEGKSGGFLPGGASLHSCMTPHGPDAETFEAVVLSENGQIPEKLPEETLSFMFESLFVPRVTKAALQSPELDKDYYKCWTGLKVHFKCS